MNTLKLMDCHHVVEAFDANLSTSRFSEVSLARAEVEHSTLEQARFKNVQFDGAQFEDCTFSGVAIRAGSYAGMTIEGVEVDAMLAAFRSAAHAAG